MIRRKKKLPVLSETSLEISYFWIPWFYYSKRKISHPLFSIYVISPCCCLITSYGCKYSKNYIIFSIFQMFSLSFHLLGLLRIVVSILTANSAPCTSNTITRAKYDSIKINWTRAQVKATVRNDGNTFSETAKAVIVFYQGTTATITYINGLVYSKTQFGLC